MSDLATESISDTEWTCPGSARKETESVIGFVQALPYP
jgi:hypothetical protein